MEYKDYYEIMGVDRDSKQEEIKRAYRKLARKYHPDVSDEANSEELFKSLGEAYEVLKDPEKRAAYDQLGANWQAGQSFEPPSGWDQYSEFTGNDFSGHRNNSESDFSDFFSSMFGQAGSQQQSRQGHSFDIRGEDHHAKIAISLEDSYQGATRALTLQSPEIDKDGRVSTRNRILNVKIPKGIKAGQKIRLAGQGSPGHGKGGKGDLYLEITFTDKDYRVTDSDVYMTLPVTPWEAALGASIEVLLPAGKVDLKIPANSNHGSKLRLKGKGLPSKVPGDFYVELVIKVPPADSDRARTLYQQMQDEIPFNPRSEFRRSDK